MDGNTWRRYRAVTERGVEPTFFLEPDNPDTWPGEWQAAGFEPQAAYFSGLNPDLSRDDPQVTRAGERLMSRGMRLRTFDAKDFEKELRIIYDLSVRCFTSNFLYTPISEAEFLAQYSAIREMIRPELVMIAEMEGEPVGFVFAIPDVLQKHRGPIDTVIVKTVAVLPERRCAGAGVWLVQEANRAARNLGYRRAIYALMHESNNSLNISARFGAPFRRYTLFARKLT
jgi:L-amino acid N-acyltransferase YncA